MTFALGAATLRGVAHMTEELRVTLSRPDLDPAQPELIEVRDTQV